MKKSVDTFRYLVLDIDGCSFMPAWNTAEIDFEKNPREDMLSPEIVKAGQSGRYVGFYICTRRCFALTFAATFSNVSLRNTEIMLGKGFDPVNLLTSAVVENLEKAMGIPCVGVSTLDDLRKTAPSELALKCGYGYEHLIKPLEETLRHVNHQLIMSRRYRGYKDITPEGALEAYFDQLEPAYRGAYQNKNIQLTHIAHHARARHQTSKIKLYFWDDEVELCEIACKLSASDLTENTYLKIIHHQAIGFIWKIIGQVSSMKTTQATTAQILNTLKPSPKEEICIIEQENKIDSDEVKTTFSIPSPRAPNFLDTNFTTEPERDSDPLEQTKSTHIFNPMG